MKRVLNITLPIFLFLLLSASVHAEPVVIKSGSVGVSLFFNQFRGGGGSLTGDGFKISYALADNASAQRSNACVFVGCAPGTAVSGSTVTTMGNNLPLFSSAVINGVTYQPVITGGSLTFTAGDVVIPVSTLDTLVLSTPFTMTGNGAVNVPGNPPTPIFSATFIGGGTAFLTFARSGENYFIQRISYRFEETAATVPEPATVLLLGTGLAGVAARMRRRARRRAEGAVTGS